MLLLKTVTKSFNPIRLTILSERDIIPTYHQSAGQRFFERLSPFPCIFSLVIRQRVSFIRERSRVKARLFFLFCVLSAFLRFKVKPPLKTRNARTEQMRGKEGHIRLCVWIKSEHKAGKGAEIRQGLHGLRKRAMGLVPRLSASGG